MIAYINMAIINTFSSESLVPPTINILSPDENQASIFYSTASSSLQLIQTNEQARDS